MNCAHCTQCFSTTKELIYHIRKEHGDVWKCGFSECTRIFSQGRDLTKHIKTHIDTTQICSSENVALPEISQHVIPILPSSSSENVECLQSVLSDQIDVVQEIKQLSRKFVLGLHNEPNLNIKQVHNITLSVVNSVLSPIERMIANLKHDSNSTKIIAQTKQQLLDLACESKLTKDLESSNQLVRTMKLSIDNCVKKVTTKHRFQYKGHETTGTYVSLLQLFKRFFELDNVFQISQSYAKTLRETNDLTNLIQGQFWKTKTKHLEGKIVIPFNLYFDDWEPDNALGSHKKANSIAATYVNFPTVPKDFASMLENILVVQLFKSKDKIYGDRNTYLNLVKECTLLEKDGITLNVNKTKTHVYFVLGLILGDNLGMHEILGLSKSFVCNYACRFCKANRARLQTMCIEESNLMRDELQYEQDLATENISETGIKHRCVFNLIPSFHVVNNISVDLMHDIYEGVCHYDLAQVLNYLILEKGYFTLELLNERKSFFDYGPMDSGNVCTQITLEHIKREKFSTSASEMRCLVSYLPLIIGKYVPKTDKVWQFFVKLITILDIITASSVSENDITLLKTLIKSHHSFYVSFFKQSLKPKYHYMIHYPRIIKDIGPLSQIWCMRHEGKHKELKRYSNCITSRMNLPLSLMKKQQLKLSYRFVSNRGFENNVLCGPVCTIKENASVVCDEELNNVKWIKFNSILYTEHLIVRTTQNEFCEIQQCFGKNKMCIFKVLMYKTIEFSKHYQAFKISPTNFIKMYSVKHFNILPTCKHENADGLFVRIKQC